MGLTVTRIMRRSNTISAHTLSNFRRNYLIMTLLSFIYDSINPLHFKPITGCGQIHHLDLITAEIR